MTSFFQNRRIVLLSCQLSIVRERELSTSAREASVFWNLAAADERNSCETTDIHILQCSFRTFSFPPFWFASLVFWCSLNEHCAFAPRSFISSSESELQISCFTVDNVDDWSRSEFSHVAVIVFIYTEHSEWLGRRIFPRTNERHVWNFTADNSREINIV